MKYINFLIILYIVEALMVTVGIQAESQIARGITGTSAAEETQSQKWAVIIGVGQYQDKGIGALPNAVNDARAVRQALTSAADGFPEANVVLLTTGESAERHPTRANILRYLRSYLSLAGPDDTVMVYFAGHGVSESGKLYLLPSDTTTAALSESGYSYSLMEQQLEESQAKKKIVILDACHSGSGRGTDTMSPEILMELEKSSQGIVTLASCSAQEKSHEMPQSGHGAFTYFLLKGMEGEADRDGNGLITASELSLYTWDATRRWAAQQGLMQTPWRLEKVAGDIVLGKFGHGQKPPISVVAAGQEESAGTTRTNFGGISPDEFRISNLRDAKAGEWTEYLVSTQLSRSPDTGDHEFTWTAKYAVISRNESSVTIHVENSSSVLAIFGKDYSEPKDITIRFDRPYEMLSKDFPGVEVTPLDQGDEELTIRGKIYACHWVVYKLASTKSSPKAYQGTIKEWRSRDVPVDGLVRQEIEYSSKVLFKTVTSKTTMELLDSGSK